MSEGCIQQLLELKVATPKSFIFDLVPFETGKVVAWMEHVSDKQYLAQ
jgi:hypothetical protein